MNHTLLQQITKKDAKAFTHSGKFHADDDFFLSVAALLKSGNHDHAWQQSSRRL